MKTYTTVQGDTFDLIAKRVLGSEMLMGALMEVNPALCDTVIFSAGVKMIIPDMVEMEQSAAGLPPWRKE